MREDKMHENLPSTPAETVVISTDELRFKLDTTIELAETFGFWRAPYTDAATMVEEMDHLDIFYWVYKSANPIVETDPKIADVFVSDENDIRLPRGFVTEKTITMGAAGDLLQVQADGLTYSKEHLFADIADLLFAKTISFANFESPITTQPLQKEVIGDSAPVIECCSEEQFEALKGFGGVNFTALNFSNNHTFDYGVEGIETTHRVFAKNNIVNVGTNRSPNEYGRAIVIEKDGVKIGFASATFGLNGGPLPEQDEHRIHVAKLCSKFSAPELGLIKQQIDDCKNKNCDFIIGSLHWGWEFEFFPRMSQIETAHALIEYGADAIIGAHPHVIQPVEYYRTKRDPNRIAVIAYSLGSITWGFNAPYIALSLILNLSFAKGRFQNEEVTYIESSMITPVFRSCAYENGKLETRIEKLCEHTLGKKNTYCTDFIEKMNYYTRLVLGRKYAFPKNP